MIQIKTQTSCSLCSHVAMRRAKPARGRRYPPVCRYQRTGKICSLKTFCHPERSRGTSQLTEDFRFAQINRRLQRLGLALASLRQQRYAGAVPHSGDNSAVAPPVPIPNTAVKRCSPDGSTAIGRARVGRRQNRAPAGQKICGCFVLASPTRAENTPCWEAGG